MENRTEHVSLRWGDFRLCQTADRQTEYIYFINRITNKRYYLAGSPTSCCALGYKKSEFDMKSIHEPPVRCPCPVAIFKELRDRRPSGCLDPYSKFYLQVCSIFLFIIMVINVILNCMFQSFGS